MKDFVKPHSPLIIPQQPQPSIFPLDFFFFIKFLLWSLFINSAVLQSICLPNHFPVQSANLFTKKKSGQTNVRLGAERIIAAVWRLQNMGRRQGKLNFLYCNFSFLVIKQNRKVIKKSFSSKKIYIESQLVCESNFCF